MGEFPSPFGVYGFSIGFVYAVAGAVHVSVPFRGLWFLNNTGLCYQTSIQKFPSPFGVYGFSIKRQDGTFGLAGFRPLSGFMVSQLENPLQANSGGQVSVPFRGLWFLNPSSIL